MMGPTTLPRSELKFTKMCRHWIAGRCKMGQSCNFAHSDLELREQPDLIATQLCFRFAAKGRCNKGAACTFAHGRGELRHNTAAVATKAKAAATELKRLGERRGPLSQSRGRSERAEDDYESESKAEEARVRRSNMASTTRRSEGRVVFLRMSQVDAMGSERGHLPVGALETHACLLHVLIHELTGLHLA
eukprot:Skav232508  [mRNA]  locus=scaffold1096:262394:271884:+ [translate_table: standard]